MTLSNEMALINGLIGGILIGSSALLLLLGNGKIAGISGIAGRALSQPNSSGWRWLFLLGLVTGAALFATFNGSLNITLPQADVQFYLAAILVGVGTRLGAGCTSGHGVCGLGRRSPRSLAATATFMGVAIVVVAMVGR